MIFLYITYALLGIFIAKKLFDILESGYVFAFNKPIYLYFHPIPKKLTKTQKYVIEREFQFYNRLTPKRKKYFGHRVQSFIENYTFIGKEDLVVTDEMKVLISGTYVMLSFGIRDYQVANFDKIIIYPKAFYSRQNDRYHKGEFNPMMKAVVFSWEDFVLGHKTDNDNINLGLHEFSHVLHLNALKVNTPSMSIFYDEFANIVKYLDDGYLNKQLLQKNYFRDYAYTNRFEFVAVVLEHFFETPAIFKSEFPELYQHVSAMINFQE
jgi:MtfA peptidase